MANGLLLREYPAGEPVDSSAHHIHPVMAVVFVILALTLFLLSWALWEALSHLWRIRLRKRLFPAIEEHSRPASPSTSTTASSPAPETPRDLEKGVTISEEPSVQPESIKAQLGLIGDIKLTIRTPDAHLRKTNLLDVHAGPKIFSAGPVSDKDFNIPPRRRMSDEGDIIPTPPPSGLFITNPSPTETEGASEHFEDVALNNQPLAHRSP